MGKVIYLLILVLIYDKLSDFFLVNLEFETEAASVPVIYVWGVFFCFGCGFLVLFWVSLGFGEGHCLFIFLLNTASPTT